MILWYHLFMGLFGKKKEEEEVDEEFEIGDDLENRKLKRQLRDLKSENKKARKEPPKPWGKKERLLVLIILLITTLVSGVLFLFSRPNFQFQMPNIKSSLAKPTEFFSFGSLNIFKEETIEIRKK